MANNIREQVIQSIMASVAPYRASNALEGAEKAYNALTRDNLLIADKDIKEKVIASILRSVEVNGAAKTSKQGAELAYNALHENNLLKGDTL